MPFATSPTALLTSLTPAQRAQGLDCTTSSINNINSLFKEVFDELDANTGIPTFVAGTGDTGALTTDIGDVCIATCGFKDWFVEGELALGTPYTLDPRLNDIAPTGLTYSILSPVSCTVVINGDGTHTVTPSNTACGTGGWSYVYRGTGGAFTDQATVRGVVANALVAYPFALTAATGVSLIISTVRGGNFIINWGDGSPEQTFITSATATHTYAPSFTGSLTVKLPVCDAIEAFNSSLGAFSFALSAVPATVKTLIATGANTISGTLASMPASSVVFNIGGANTISGSLASIPATNSFFRVAGSNIISGALQLPLGNTYFELRGLNTVSGTTTSIPNGNTFFELLGSNTLSGSLAGIPTTNTYFQVTGSNTISGSLTNMRPGNTIFSVAGLNTISGTVANIVASNLTFSVQGSNTISGTLAGMPAGNITFLVTGANTISGPLAMAATTTTFNVGGNNTISGTLAGISAVNVSFTMQGANTVSGTLASLPATNTTFTLLGNNTVSGALTSVPAVNVFFQVSGTNTINGTLAAIRPNNRYFSLTGQNTVVPASAAWTGATTAYRFFELAGTGITGPQVDTVLASLTNITSWATERNVRLAGLNGPASAAGIVSANQIITNGALTVLYN